jgi:prolyl-tRNA synthetase
MEAGNCVMVTRNDGNKETVPLEGVEKALERKLEEVRSGLYAKALANRERRTYVCHTIDEINACLTEKGDGFVKAMWCGEEACEDKVKELTGVCSRCIPIEQEHLGDTCVCCGKPAKHMLYWGKAY